MAQLHKLKINPELVYLAEAMKVEGYWSRKSFTLTIQNKNLPFLKYIEKIVGELGMPIHKRILLKIKLPINLTKDKIKLLCKKKSLSFHLEKSPFDGSMKVVTNQPYKDNYNLNLIFKNKSYKINIKIGKEEILVKSKLKGWAYLDMRFPNRVIISFLDEYVDKKDLLNNSPKEYVASAFSALIDAEGSIDWYGLKRIIRIRMRNKEYLKKWSKLLSKYSVGNKFRRNDEVEWEVSISGWEDFNKLNLIGLKLHHSKKADRWSKMMKGFKRNQISRNSYKKFYIDKLKEIGRPISTREFAIMLDKSKRVVSHYLLKLEKIKLISCNKKHWPYLYFISTSSVRS